MKTVIPTDTIELVLYELLNQNGDKHLMDPKKINSGGFTTFLLSISIKSLVQRTRTRFFGNPIVIFQ